MAVPVDSNDSTKVEAVKYDDEDELSTMLYELRQSETLLEVAHKNIWMNNINRADTLPHNQLFVSILSNIVDTQAEIRDLIEKFDDRPAERMSRNAELVSDPA